MGFGLTVTSTLKAVPAQPLAVGVTAYLITPGEVPVLVSACAIGLPEPLPYPVMVPPAGTVCIAAVQVYVVPPTVEFNATFVVALLQTVSGDAEPTGVVFIATVTSNLKMLSHPPVV